MLSSTLSARRPSSSAWVQPNSYGSGWLDRRPIEAQNLVIFGDLRSFKPKELIPSEPQRLWMIEQGFVKTVLWNKAGKGLLLGFWREGDLVAQPSTSREEYQVECMTSVKARLCPVDAASARVTMAAQILQMEFLLELMHCYPMPRRIMKFLGWLAQKAGYVTEEGCILDLSLTHQAIAEMIGTNRVTVTRQLQQLEAEGQLAKLRRHRIILLGGWQDD
jgi:CRP-like cAMP-binding protein